MDARPFTILFIGRLYPAKRVDTLIETIAILVRRNQDVRAVIVGDGHLRATLEQQARGMPSVCFAGAEFDEVRLANYFADADILFMPDAVGLGVIHAFSNAVPILTAQNGRAHGPEVDYIVDGENGVLVDDLDPVAFANQIEALIDDPVRLHALRRGALATARTLPIDRMVDGLVEAARHVRTRKREAVS